MILSYVPSIHCAIRCSAHDLQYLIRIFVWLAVKNTAFYKLYAAARIPIDSLTFAWVRRMIMSRNTGWADRVLAPYDEDTVGNFDIIHEHNEVTWSPACLHDSYSQTLDFEQPYSISFVPQHCLRSETLTSTELCCKQLRLMVWPPRLFFFLHQGRYWMLNHFSTCSITC